MYVIYLNGEPIYAATDQRRFERELVKHADNAKVTWRLVV